MAKYKVEKGHEITDFYSDKIVMPTMLDDTTLFFDFKTALQAIKPLSKIAKNKNLESLKQGCARKTRMILIQRDFHRYIKTGEIKANHFARYDDHWEIFSLVQINHPTAGMREGVDYLYKLKELIGPKKEGNVWSFRQCIQNVPHANKLWKSGAITPDFEERQRWIDSAKLQEKS